MEETVYYINQKGIDLLGVDTKPLTKNLQVDHYLMRNDLYIYYGCPDDWKLEPKNKYQVRDGVGLASKILVSDARFTKNELHYFVEVDNTQHMKENQKKVDAYKEFQASFKGKFKQTPTIVFYTVSDNRKKKLDEMCDRAGLYYQVLIKKDLWT